METITISINNEEGRKLLHKMQEERFVTIVNTPNFDSLIFPGEPLTKEQFKARVELREGGGSMTLKEAKINGQKKRNNFWPWANKNS